MSTEPTQDERNAAAAAIMHAQGWYDDLDEPAEPETADDCRYSGDGRTEWLILTDEEADARAADDVKESLWAFVATYLAEYMPEGINAEEIEAIRGDRCESANPAMLALVQAGPSDLETLTADAISTDGRGHFMSSYDGEEIEHEHAGRTWYAYRVN